MVTTAKGKKVATIKGVKTVVKTNAKVKLVVKKKLQEGQLPLQGLRHRHRRQQEQEGDAGDADREVGARLSGLQSIPQV